MGTPIQRLRWEAGDGNEVFVKRDDLLPFSFGGNKVRIAEVFYGDMEAKGCDTMLLYGSLHSNLCRVLSVLCRSRGTRCWMLCSHEEGEQEQTTNNACLIQWGGAKVVHCLKSEIAPAVEAVMEEIRREGGKPYYIYGNKYGVGNEGVAASAYADAYREMEGFDYLFCPSGTGATQSGLICGHLLAGDQTRILGVMISSRETGRAHRVVRDGVAAYFGRIGRELPERFEEEILLLDQYRQAGYGKYDGRIEECIRRRYLTDGLPLDPIYTGKAFWGMTEYLKEAGIRDSRILFLHTGGTPLFFDYLAARP